MKGDDAIVIGWFESALADPETPARRALPRSPGESRYLNELAAFAKDQKLAEELRVAAIEAIGCDHHARVAFAVR